MPWTIRTMRFSMSAGVLAFIIGATIPLPVSAEDCTGTGTVTFDVQPRTVSLANEESRFRSTFTWDDGTAPVCFGTIIKFRFIDNFQARDFTVRERTRTTRDPVNVDFNQRWITTPGEHKFRLEIILDTADRQITESAPVQVTASGEAPAAAEPAPSYAGGPPQAGPTRLEVAIGGLTSAANIAEYIAAIFKYALSIGGVIATVMVVYGGVKWLLAAGDATKIGEAKGVITNAVVGLVLLLGSYLILFTLNPEIVRLRALDLPKIERAVLTSNWCEEQNLNEVKITPGSGNCGQEGKVEARNPGEIVTGDSCKFRTCPEGESCVGFGGAFQCRACGDIDDDLLETFGLSENDAGCAPFAPAPVGGAYSYCFFSEDDRLSVTDDVCAFAQIRCSQIETCRDYDDVLLLHGGRPIEIDSETKDAYAGYNPEHIKKICESNPCNVQGGCVLRESSNISQFLNDIGGLKGAPTGDLYDCESP